MEKYQYFLDGKEKSTLAGAKKILCGYSGYVFIEK